MKQFHYALITAAFAALLLSACGSADTDTAGSSGDNSLVVLNYGKYLDASAIKMFEQETGIKIKLEEYESPEEMYTKFSAGSISYDVVRTSDYMVERLIHEGKVAPIDFSSFSYYKNLDPAILAAAEVFDPQNQYSMPYFYGTLGILYNTTMVSEEETESWNILWDDRYRDTIIMQNSVRDSFVPALRLLGRDINTEDETDLSLLAARESHSNKGTFGRLLVIAGSQGMSGAAYLCAKAAYASGCGLVRIFTPEENRAILQTQLPEAVITAYSSKKAEAPQLLEAMSWADTIVCGPGIGTPDTAAGMVRTVIKNAAVPVLLDADALNVIAKDTNLLLLPHTELVVTPHLGEMSRLTGDSVAYLQNHLIEAADEFARQYNVICVLKDEHTATAIPYSQTWLNVSGNAGLATAGSGDVLSGIIGGLMAQGIRVEQAAPLGVYLHGKAGEAAGARRSMRGMTASDIHDGMCEILAGLEQTQSQPGKDGIS